MAAAMAAVMAAMAAVKAVMAAVEAVMTVMAVMAAMVAALYILPMPVLAASGEDGFTRRRPPSANFYEVTVSIYSTLGEKITPQVVTARLAPYIPRYL